MVIWLAKLQKQSKKVQRRGGRQKIPIDLVELEKLSFIGSSETDMAYWVGMSLTAFRKRRADDKEIQDAIDRGRVNGKSALRRKQFEVALAGSVPMLIWLGKNILGQLDSPPPQTDLDEDMPMLIARNGQLVEIRKDDI